MLQACINDIDIILNNGIYPLNKNIDLNLRKMRCYKELGDKDNYDIG